MRFSLGKTFQLKLLLLLSQDQYANAFLHDANMTFSVPLYRVVSADS